ncbi:MlaA family lipoprotein [Fusobacterium russii]|uniref:MlaA family lipoprotein n=1 Tax=Fusobacterium russii TaxID=854 RepID=UPI00039BCA39|nr:VacJ family lipoprotein [Fusobacterium russii]
MKNKAKLFIIFLILVFSACSNIRENNNINSMKTDEISNSVNQKTSNLDEYFGANEDPWEGFNRRVYYFNYNVDKYALLPIVRTYKFITPVFIQNRVTNFFRNIKGINTTANSLAQLKGRKAMRAVARFAINTIFGLGGIFDVATKMGMPKPYEDFGLTLAHYGVPRGPYLILPLLGPSYLRDVFGMGVESLTTKAADPYRHMELFEINSKPVTVLSGIDKRKNVKFEYYGTSSPFEYEYVRFLWSRYRKLQEETGVQFF